MAALNNLATDLKIVPAIVDVAATIFLAVALTVVPIIVDVDPVMDFNVNFFVVPVKPVATDTIALLVALVVVAANAFIEAGVALPVRLATTATIDCATADTARVVSFATDTVLAWDVAAKRFDTALLMVPIKVFATANKPFDVDFDAEPATDDIEALRVRLVPLLAEPDIALIVAVRIDSRMSPRRKATTLPPNEFVTAFNTLPTDLNIDPAIVDVADTIVFDVVLIVAPIIVAADPAMDLAVVLEVVADKEFANAEIGFFVRLSATPAIDCATADIARLVNFATDAATLWVMAVRLLDTAFLVVPAKDDVDAGVILVVAFLDNPVHVAITPVRVRYCNAPDTE